MNKTIQDFNNYKLIHEFAYPDQPLKGWIDETTYINVYRRDWNALVEIIQKIYHLSVKEQNSNYKVSFDHIVKQIPNLADTYKAVVETIEEITFDKNN